MKFKINKNQLEMLRGQFEKNDSSFEEIELEPVLDTAKEAIHIQQIKTESWHQGYHYGFKEGYYTARDHRCFSPLCCDSDCKFR